MSEKIIIQMEENGIVHLKMNDAEGKNTFTADFVAELIRSLEKTSDMKPKVLILQGLPDIFCGGADKKDLMDLCEGKLAVKDFIIQETLLNLPFPVIAAMEGHAIGGGFAMAMYSDIILAARESRYGAVFMQLGFTPGMGCTTMLSELVGPYIASEMMFSGKRFKGSELAHKSTNINYILPREEIMPKAEDIALQISEKNIKSIYILKHALSVKKKKLLIDARLQEDLMHRISFAFPETRAAIEEFYVELD
ncbi:MAG: polyketide synthase [Candidatus Aminicenantes bacterium]|nr:polyketide synthase [Candidatus Aminicenantes bacterium]MDH5466606.1 polyketide synthase [Candidatus Aminicenantes bacterium]MDH5704898.1 polyketide synthase [Candidatus Aminicenantes bacterium]